MAKIKSGIEESAIKERTQQLDRNRDYNKKDNYSSSHRKAKSTTGQALGKGNDNGGHGVYVPKTENKDDFKNSYVYSSLDSSTPAGGDYDIKGRNGDGGREKLLSINIYSRDNEYGNIDITDSIEDQYIVSMNEN
jgi:hypothetical protein